MTQEQMFEGMGIFRNYDEVSERVNWEHDILYAGNTPPNEMDSGDVEKLDALEWYWNDEYNCWYHFA